MTSHTALPAAASRANRGHDPYDRIEPWLEKMAALPQGDPERDRLREQILDRCLPLAEHIARRFARRGETFEDLYQVASLGLVLAVDRYDVAKAATFVSFAVPTIMGEVRRHFRDRTWAVRVPRPTKELQADLGPAVERLAQRLRRMPTTTELATELHVDRLDLTQALLAANAYTADTLDAPTGAGEHEPGTARVTDEPGSDDTGYELTDDALTIAPLLRELPPREREVLRLRFFENQTQAQIGEQIGVSQMQVCRILTTTLTTLRHQALPR